MLVMQTYCTTTEQAVVGQGGVGHGERIRERFGTQIRIPPFDYLGAFWQI
jgi:hypothetical protein